MSPAERQATYSDFRDQRDAQRPVVDLVSGKSVAIGAGPVKGRDKSVQWT